MMEVIDVLLRKISRRLKLILNFFLVLILLNTITVSTCWLGAQNDITFNVKDIMVKLETLNIYKIIWIKQSTPKDTEHISLCGGTTEICFYCITAFQNWSMAEVSPILENGSTGEVNNFRPISSMLI